MKLLISTPQRILSLDLDSGLLHSVLEAVGGYGISWCGQDVFAAHTDPSGEKGRLTRLTKGSHPVALDIDALAPHQIECIDGDLVMANTGYNRIDVLDLHGRLRRSAWPDPERKMDSDENGDRGHHWNSVHRVADRLWVVAHNHNRPSELWGLTWPGLVVAEVLPTRSRWAHNVWPCELGLVVCDTRDGSLLDVREGACIWRPDEVGILTRGLAATSDYIVVGRSEILARSQRPEGDAGLWVIDRKSLRIVDSFILKGMGEVRDLRILDVPDECHHGQTIDSASLPARRMPADIVLQAKRSQRARSHPAAIPAPPRRGRGLRVCLWSPQVNLGGGARLLEALATALANRPDVELHLAAPAATLSKPLTGDPRVRFHPLTVPEPSARRLPPLSHESRFLGIPGSGRVRSYLRSPSGPWDQRTLRQVSEGCDVIWCPWPHRQPFPVAEKPLVITLQDMIFFEFPEWMSREALSDEWRQIRMWLEGSAAVITSSKATGAAVARHFGGQFAPNAVIHHAISPGRSAPSPTPPWAPDRPYVICAANTSPHKNHYNLLHAWSRFSGRHDFTLVLIGAGTSALDQPPPAWMVGGIPPTRLVSLMNRLGLMTGSDIDIRGWVDDPSAHWLIEHAAALVMPSLAEGGGSFPAEEALVAGVPVLCSDIPVMREHLSRRTAKVAWFDPECVGSMVAAFEDLFSNYEDYRVHAQAGMTDPRPSWDDVASEYASVFRSVAG